LADLQRFELTDRKIDNDTVGVKTFRLNACFEATRGGRIAERPIGRQLSLEVFNQDLVLSDDQHFGHRFIFQIAKGHTMLLEELDQIFTRDAAVLRTRDAISLQATGVEPFADRARGHFADLRDLTSSKDLHRALQFVLLSVR
jgi:hypothetical protein